MSRIGKRYFAKSEYLSFKRYFFSYYPKPNGLAFDNPSNEKKKDMIKLFILLGIWKGLHKKFLEDRKYGNKYRNKNRNKLRSYHRHYKRKHRPQNWRLKPNNPR